MGLIGMGLITLVLTAGLALGQEAPQPATPSQPLVPPPPSPPPAPVVVAAPAGPPVLPAQVMAEISSARVKASVEKLVSFGTRHTLSETQSETRGIGAARRWIKSEFKSYGPKLIVFFDEFDAPPSARVPQGGQVVNVVALLPGTMKETKRAYYVVGHYDSRNGDAMDATGDSPGANDDASGTAVVMEIARVLAERPLESTVVFLCTAGEEQGLIGAKFHADRAAAEKGLDIRGVLNNDIVGDPSSPAGPIRDRIRLFSEGLPRNPTAERLAQLRSLSAESDSASRQLARFIFETAQQEQTAIKPMLVFRPDRFLRGGDHSAFNEAGFPAVRFTVMHEWYDRQHQDVVQKDGKPYGDVAEFVDADYVGNVARLNAAVLVRLANAPSAPPDARVLTKALQNDTTVKWSPSPEPDVAGYEIVWRDTTAPMWEHAMDAGNATEKTIPVSKDIAFIGVRAYDRDGYRSPVSFCAAGQD